MRPSWHATTSGTLTYLLVRGARCCALPQLPTANPHHYNYPDRSDQKVLLPAEDQSNANNDFDFDVSVQTLPFLSQSPSGSSQQNPAILPLNFPDPCLLHDPDNGGNGTGTWYAFATAGNGRQVQAATAPAAEGPWTYLSDVDVLPDPGSWTTGQNTWAPDVRRVAEGRYVMYYSGQRRRFYPEDCSGERQVERRPMHYCLGVAVASSPLGPYVPVYYGEGEEQPWACAEERGGIIDPSGFLDPATGRRYVAYKIDGNSIGPGGSCGNGIGAGAVPTPILLQEVDALDGVTRVGEPVEILDREEVDGPLVEAPSLAYLAAGATAAGQGRYVLFYSSHCWSEEGYNVNYATAERVEGPYSKSRQNPLLQTGDFGLTAPGGATVVEGEDRLVFHANCEFGRCMFETAFSVNRVDIITGEEW